MKIPNVELLYHMFCRLLMFLQHDFSKTNFQKHLHLPVFTDQDANKNKQLEEIQ